MEKELFCVGVSLSTFSSETALGEAVCIKSSYCTVWSPGSILLGFAESIYTFHMIKQLLIWSFSALNVADCCIFVYVYPFVDICCRSRENREVFTRLNEMTWSHESVLYCSLADTSASPHCKHSSINLLDLILAPIN